MYPEYTMRLMKAIPDSGCSLWEEGLISRKKQGKSRKCRKTVESRKCRKTVESRKFGKAELQ